MSLMRIAGASVVLSPSEELEAAAQALGDALESMAFLSLAPQDVPTPPSGPALRVEMPFGQDLRATLELVAPEEFGRLLFANISGQPGSSSTTRGQAADALVELVNATCGLYLSRQKERSRRQMGVPAYGPFNAALEWSIFLGSGAVAVDAEGYTLGLCVRQAA